MDYTTFLEHIRKRIISLNLQSFFNVINMMNFYSVVNDITDENINESFNKLLKMDFNNKKSLYNIVSDLAMDDVDLLDIDDCLALLMDNYRIQDEYFLNILNYLLIIDDYTVNDNDLVLALDEFLNVDESCSKEFDFNFKILKKIREER